MDHGSTGRGETGSSLKERIYEIVKGAAYHEGESTYDAGTYPDNRDYKKSCSLIHAFMLFAH